MSVNAYLNRQYRYDQQGMESEWLKIIPLIIRWYYRCCCINEPVIFSHCVHLKLGHRFHALLKVCSDRDDIVPLKVLAALKKLAFSTMVTRSYDLPRKLWSHSSSCFSSQSSSSSSSKSASSLELRLLKTKATNKETRITWDQGNTLLI